MLKNVNFKRCQNQKYAKIWMTMNTTIMDIYANKTKEFNVTHCYENHLTVYLFWNNKYKFIVPAVYAPLKLKIRYIKSYVKTSQYK